MLHTLIASAWLTALGGADGCWRGTMYYDAGFGSSKYAVMPVSLCRATSPDGLMTVMNITYHDALGDVEGVSVAVQDGPDGLRETYAMPGEATLSVYETEGYGADAEDSWLVSFWGEEFDGDGATDVRLQIEREGDQLWFYKSVLSADGSKLTLRHRTELKRATE